MMNQQLASQNQQMAKNMTIAMTHIAAQMELIAVGLAAPRVTEIVKDADGNTVGSRQVINTQGD